MTRHHEGTTWLFTFEPIPEREVGYVCGFKGCEVIATEQPVMIDLVSSDEFMAWPMCEAHADTLRSSDQP